MSNFMTVLEGKYNYYRDKDLYSEEIFTVKQQEKSSGNIKMESETSTRTKTGEFLKIQVKYLMSSSFKPINVEVKRFMGDRESTELFTIDKKTKAVNYLFSNNDESHQYTKIIPHVTHIATPCFATFMNMSLSKKIDPVHRTDYTLITSSNIWNYNGPFIEKPVYLELQELEHIPIKIGDNELKASHCKILQVDENGTISNNGYDIYLSKYLAIPYRAIFDDGMVVEIETLKNYESRYNKWF